MAKEKKYSIYLLSCPETGDPKYIGQSANPRKRYNQHCLISNNLSNTKRCRWLKSILNKGLKPVMLILENNLDCYDIAEKNWIKFYKDNGHDLINGNDGGFDLAHTQRAPRSNKVRGRTSLAQWLADINRMANGKCKYIRPEAVERAKVVYKNALIVCQKYRKAKAYDVLEGLFDKWMVEKYFNNYGIEICLKK